MGRKGRAPKVTRMHDTETKIQNIPRDRDNTDDLVEAELKARSAASPFPHPGSKKIRRGSFEGNASSAQGPNNAVVRP
jgi:hypothetical protein